MFLQVNFFLLYQLFTWSCECWRMLHAVSLQRLLNLAYLVRTSSHHRPLHVILHIITRLLATGQHSTQGVALTPCS
jgi:hypothetical protein